LDLESWAWSGSDQLADAAGWFGPGLVQLPAAGSSAWFNLQYFIPLPWFKRWRAWFGRWWR
jgi:hypothetical protein